MPERRRLPTVEEAIFKTVAEEEAVFNMRSPVTPRWVVVAFVAVKLVAVSFVEERLVAPRFVAVALVPEKFVMPMSVDEAEFTRRPPEIKRFVEEVAVREATWRLASEEEAFEMSPVEVRSPAGEMVRRVERAEFCTRNTSAVPELNARKVRAVAVEEVASIVATVSAATSVVVPIPN